MVLKWAHYCVEMQPNGWGVDVINMLSHFGADPGKPLELPPLPVHLGVRLHAPSGFKLDGHVLQATIKNNGQPLSATQSVPLNFLSLPPGYPTIGLGLVPLNNWTLPTIGIYDIDLAVDGSPIGQIPLVIQRRYGDAPTPQPGGTADIRLIWSHHAMIISSDPKLPGMVSIGGVFEFLPTDPSKKAFNLKGFLLLLHIESDLTIHTERELRTELLDETGQPACSGDGKLLLAPLVRRINLRRLNPAWGFLASTATVRFENDVWLRPGKYLFRFFLDKKPFGAPLELTAVGPGSPSISALPAKP